MNNWFKRNGIHLAITGIFVVLCFVYFNPVLQGKMLYQGDVMQAKGMAREIMEFKARDGKAPLWTDAMFGGMPAYQIWVQYPMNITTYVISFFKTVFPNPVDTVLLYLLGAYLLFCVLRVNPWLAAAGAIAFAFSSYNFIIIEAGHSNKAMAIAFFPPILAGILLTLRGNLLVGASLTALSLALEIRANHIQMTYYLFMALLILMGIEVYHAYKNKTTKTFYKSFAYLAGATILAIAVNAGMLWTTYEYGQESTRGKSNLTTEKSVPNNGLDREYAYQWSQGIGESITFLIPDAYGGASSPVRDEKSEVAKVLTERGVPQNQVLGAMQQLAQAGLTTYWGNKPFTAGPYYFGSVIFFLFILGLFIVRSRLKWWVLSATILSLVLSFGNNWPLISDLFFNYFPLYNKFRAVESVLVIAGLLFPVLAVLAVKELAETKADPKDLFKKFLYSFYITAGVLAVVIILPGLVLSFKTSVHDQVVQQLVQITGGDRSFADALGNAIIRDRTSIARMDALRSLIFVLIGAGIIWAILKKKISIKFAFIVLAAVILADMWAVNNRYFNNSNFVDKAQMDQQFQPGEIDQLILRDTSLNYRVLDLSAGNPFSSAKASYFHRSIGGYHAAKLKRFQEVLDRQFNNAINEDILDMLNTKYIITGDNQGNQKIQNRSTASGAAWIVQSVSFVKNADEEMLGINSFDPKKEAFIGREFKSLIDTNKVGADPNAFIRLTNYRPDHLTYEYSAGKNVIAVFSEIWYDKGWNAYVDGNKIPHFRADYILRAAQLPGGNHTVEFKFEPKSYYTGEIISLIASVILLAGIGYVIYTEIRKNRTGKTA